jgi:hypothetical protein
MTEKQNDIQP